MTTVGKKAGVDGEATFERLLRRFREERIVP